MSKVLKKKVKKAEAAVEATETKVKKVKKAIEEKPEATETKSTKKVKGKTVFVVKNVFTKGIETYTVNDYDKETIAQAIGKLSENKDWFKTREEAVAKAEEIKAIRLNALKAQLKAIKDLTFTS